MRKIFVAAAALAAVMAVAVAAPPKAESFTLAGSIGSFGASLDPVPHDPAADAGSNVSGRAQLFRVGNLVSVRVRATGLSPLPHAMHIHGKDNPEVAFCPGADRRDDLVDDGLIETVEGLDDYGPVQVSLTTRGDTSTASTLALDRFPVANAGGVLNYQRFFAMPLEIASRLEAKHIVIHGVDLNGNATYEGRITALGAPLEAELPVACGEIDPGFRLGFGFGLFR